MGRDFVIYLLVGLLVFFMYAWYTDSDDYSDDDYSDHEDFTISPPQQIPQQVQQPQVVVVPEQQPNVVVVPRGRRWPWWRRWRNWGPGPWWRRTRRPVFRRGGRTLINVT